MAGDGHSILIASYHFHRDGGDDVSSASRGLMWGAGLLAGFVLLAVLAGVVATGGVSEAAQLYFEQVFLERARAYNRLRYLILLYRYLAPVVLLALAASRRWDRGLARWAGRITGPHSLAPVVLAAAILGLAATVAQLPADLARFLLDHRFGLSTQPPGLWLSDLVKSTALGLAIGLPLLAALFWLIRRSPARWWAPATAGFALYLVASSLLAPVVIDPLFHRFTPLRDAALAQELLELAQHAGVPVQEILVMDASRRTLRVNAYFTGFGSTRRIVLYDTLLQAYDRQQILQVMAHELGHWRQNHIYRGIALGVAGSALVFWLAAQLLRGYTGRPGSSAQVAGLLLFLTLLSIATLPLESAASRRMERQADHFALALLRDGQGAAELQMRLARDNLADVAPHRFTAAVLFTHPPTVERIERALAIAP